MKVKLGGNFNEVPDSAPAPVGLYTAKVAAVDERPSSNTGEPMVEVRWDIVADANGKGLKDPKTGKKAQYDPVFTYHPLDPESSWARRMKELLTALGVKLTGTVDIKNGSKALLRLKDGEDLDGNYRPNVAKIMKLGSAPADEEEDEGEEPEEDAEEEAEEEEVEVVDLDSMDRAEMKQFIKDNELGIRVLTKDDDDALREKIKAALPDEEEEEEEEEEPEEEEEEEDTVDLSELSRTELKAFIKENDLDVKVLKKDSDDDVRSKIAEALGSSEEEAEEEEEEDGEEADNYDELDLDTLKQECKDRELKDTGTKKALVARLRKDDAEEPV